MKKLFLSTALLWSVFANANEGMWLPQLLGQQKYAEMKAKGLKLTAEQLYSINKASIKDAIVIFGGGCTGEIVSKEGLIFTNHHCGYGNIASLSSVEHNYLDNGFYAKSKEEELPAKGLSVQFLVSIADITKQVEDSIKTFGNYADWEKSKTRVFNNIAKASTSGTGYEARVSSMFKDNQFLLYTYERYNDVRLVGTPPQSVGKFGGDTDNWVWPRHTGDFSIFRVYMSKDGKAAAYNKENIPYKPKHYLPVSIKGVKEGDFSMIFGYPGSTNRFETSYGINLATGLKNPAFVKMRDIRLKAMHTEMQKSTAVKLSLASSYAGLANYWKFYDGETKQLLKYDVAGTKAKQEQELVNWAKANNKQEYVNIFSDYAKAYDAWKPYAKMKEYYEQGILGPGVVKLANAFGSLERAYDAGNQDDVKKLLDNLDKVRSQSLEGINIASEEVMLPQLVQAFYTDIDNSQKPADFYTTLAKNFGDLSADDTYKKWSKDLFRNSIIINSDKWNAFKENPSVDVLKNDPLYSLSKAFKENWDKVKDKFSDFTTINNELGNKYLKAYLEKNKGGKFYPDANFTMRTSFGKVASYIPFDGAKYDYVTTSKGILEKYIPGDFEFDLPANQIELLKKKDFGRYIDKSRNDLVVNFITNDDITGGNSGSPVINGQGHLIGLAFDGNYEALSHKINFEDSMNRTICVDIRYVLWCIDKLGGAKNIINELTIVQ